MTAKWYRLMWSVLLAAALLAMTACADKTASDSESVLETAEQTENAEEEKQTELELPYEFDEGRLVLNSIFQSSISNPDCGDEDGENIASIEVINQSGKYLASADITVTLADETVLKFNITDIPEGKTVLAFETGNTELPDDFICSSVVCEAQYEEEIPMMSEAVSIEAEGTTVTIQNLTGEPLDGLEASFHCLFDEDMYYGGTTYTYPIDTIQGGGSISLEIYECYLGTAEAVRIIQKNES